MEPKNNNDQGETINTDSFEQNLESIDNQNQGGQDDQDHMNFHDEDNSGNDTFYQGDFDGNANIDDVDDDFDDKSDFDGVNNTSFMEEEEEQEEEDLDFNEDQNQGEGGDNNSDEDIDEPDANDEAELARLNKLLDTNFSSLEEAKKELKQEENNKSSDEEQKMYEDNEKTIGYLGTLLNQSDEDLVREERMLRANRQGKDLNDKSILEEVEDEIEEELDSMSRSGTLRMNADNIRKEIKGAVGELKSKNEQIDQKKTQVQQQAEQEKIEQMENEFAEIYKDKKFLGVNLDSQTVKNAYKKARQKNYFEEQLKNPKQAARLALMLELQDKIAQRSSNPSPAEVARQIVGQKGRKANNRQNMSAASRSGSSAARKSSVSSSRDNNVDLWLQ